MKFGEQLAIVKFYIFFEDFQKAYRFNTKITYIQQQCNAMYFRNKFENK